MDLNTIPAMPATNCPAWCEAQDRHAADWAREVELFSRSWDMPRNDGTVAHLEPLTAERIAASWEPLHLRRLYYLELDAAEAAEIDVQSGIDGAPVLYLDAQGAITVERGRQIAAALLNAADTFDALGAA